MAFISVSLLFCQCYKLGVTSSKFKHSDKTEHPRCTHLSCSHEPGWAQGAWQVPGRQTAGGSRLATVCAVLISRSIRSFQIRETLKMQNAEVNPKHTWSLYFCLFLILTLNTFPVHFWGDQPSSEMWIGTSDIPQEVREQNSHMCAYELVSEARMCGWPELCYISSSVQLGHAASLCCSNCAWRHPGKMIKYAPVQLKILDLHRKMEHKTDILKSGRG